MIIIARILLLISRLVIRRYQPKIIGITGSVGKTSAKEAICAVLTSRFRVRHSVKSYNNEIGVPLTIIGCESANRSMLGWLKIFFFGMKLGFFKDKNYPEMLVLEMGADRPGDIASLISLAPSDIGVLTAIAPTHLEKFLTMENVAAEKRLIVTRLRRGGVAIINADDELTSKTEVPGGVTAFSYGFKEGAKVRGSDLIISNDLVSGKAVVRGLSFKISYAGSSVPILLRGVVGKPSTMAALAACAVGLHYGMNLIDIGRALQDVIWPPGRLRLIQGINNTLIIDDSYNSSPRAALTAIETFISVPLAGSARRCVVLGDMLELGDYSEAGHIEVGQRLTEGGVDVIITVGERARAICRAARLGGFDPASLYCFSETSEAVKFLRDFLRSDDAVLVKGSQAMRLERVVKEIMLEPERAPELLVRQGSEWQRA